MSDFYPQEPSQGRGSSSPETAHPAQSSGVGGRRILCVLVLGLIAALAVAAARWSVADETGAPATASAKEKKTSAPVWETDFDKALARAAERNRLVLLRFTADWCAPCKVMERSVFPDPKVKQTLTDRVIPVKLDIDDERNEELAWRYKTTAVPTLLLIDVDGKVLDRGGFMSAKELVKFLGGS